MTQGRYVALDAAETLSKFLVDGSPDAARFADVMGNVIEPVIASIKGRVPGVSPGFPQQAFSPEGRRGSGREGEQPRLALFGEMVALLWAQGKCDAAIQLEQLWNDLAVTYSFDLRCAYPMSLFGRAGDSELFAKVCATHSHVIPAESYTSLSGEDERLRAITILQQKAQSLEAEIEERTRAQERLRETNDELRKAVEDRDEFLSVAAHELKTPVTVLRSFAQLLLRDIRRNGASTPERTESALRAIEVQTGKLAHLITRLLDTAQIEAGKLRIEPVATDLVALVQSVLAQQQDGSGHAFVFDGPEQVEAMIDPVRFEQVITNLLDNAVKFSPQGGTVTVELRRDNSGIRLSVTDQGVGISPDQREAVFGRFHQAHDAHHLSGMGLGLYIAREIVELHGGCVHVEECEHPGSSFVVILPSRTPVD
jgi:signal transduction histidine kinase